MAYIIKITHKTSDNHIRHGYYSLAGTFTKNKVLSRNFVSYIQATNHVNAYKMAWADDDVYIIDEKNDLGTYFSTYKKKVTIKGILVNTMCIILLPVIIPIEGCLIIKEYIMKLIGKSYR